MIITLATLIFLLSGAAAVILFLYLIYTLARRIFGRNFKPLISVWKTIAMLILSIALFISIPTLHYIAFPAQPDWATRELPGISLEFPYKLTKDTKSVRNLKRQVEFPPGDNIAIYTNRHGKENLFIMVMRANWPSRNQQDIMDDFRKRSARGASAKDITISGKECSHYSTPLETAGYTETHIMCKTGANEWFFITILKTPAVEESEIERVKNSIVFPSIQTHSIFLSPTTSG